MCCDCQSSCHSFVNTRSKTREKKNGKPVMRGYFMHPHRSNVGYIQRFRSADEANGNADASRKSRAILCNPVMD